MRYTVPRKMKKHPLSDETEYAMRVARDMGETNDCSVRAVTVLTGKPYEQVRGAFARAGRMHGEGSTEFMADDALKELGFKRTALGPMHFRRAGQGKPDWVKAITDRYPGVHRNVAGLTTFHPRRFPEAWADMPPLLLLCKRHHAAFKDGIVHDFSSNRPFQIIQAWTIEPLDE